MSKFAVLFDWDGVVIDSREQHEKSWDLLAARENLPLPEGHFENGFGMRNESIIPDILGWSTDPEEISRLAFEKEEAYRELVRKNGIEPLPGVREFLTMLAAAGIPTAVGSSTPRSNIDCALEITGIGEFFRKIIAAEDVTRGKPDPEVFLNGAKALGVSPDRCIVLEDAHVGIQAARAGGMKVVGVATTHPAESLSKADLVVHRLDELDLASLRQLAGY
ncbi:MAG: HAD family phosphatase [Verrucomicrobiales bacterium]|nr:HAD family phosphatase [Verrucomicrobiales bacterium]